MLRSVLLSQLMLAATSIIVVWSSGNAREEKSPRILADLECGDLKCPTGQHIHADKCVCVDDNHPMCRMMCGEG